MCPRDQWVVQRGKVRESVPQILRSLPEPLLHAIAALTETVTRDDKEVKRLCREVHSATKPLRLVPGVCPVTAVATSWWSTPGAFRSQP